jgi:hypothetical protein
MAATSARIERAIFRHRRSILRNPTDGNPALRGPRRGATALCRQIELARTMRLVRTGKVRIFKVIAGFGLLLAGIVMLVVPGPGWLTIAGGLTILATEFAWARRARDAIKTTLTGWRQRLKKAIAHGDNTRKETHPSDERRAEGAGSRRDP